MQSYECEGMAREGWWAVICNCDVCNAGGQCASQREMVGTPQSMAAAILDLRARLAEAAAGMEQAVRERDEARAALAKEVARDDDITRLHRHLIAERDAAIARAEAAEQRADERAAHATWQATEWNADTAALRQCAIELGEDGSPTREVYKRARAERAAREKAEAACGALWLVIRQKHYGRIPADVDAAMTLAREAAEPVMSELYALRDVQKAAETFAAIAPLTMIPAELQALRAALDAVPKEKP